MIFTTPSHQYITPTHSPCKYQTDQDPGEFFKWSCQIKTAEHRDVSNFNLLFWYNDGMLRSKII